LLRLALVAEEPVGGVNRLGAPRAAVDCRPQPLSIVGQITGGLIAQIITQVVGRPALVMMQWPGGYYDLAIIKPDGECFTCYGVVGGRALGVVH
jgi:hypothetical protein